MNRERIIDAIIKNSIDWRKHALIRMLERGITRLDVEETLINGEIIENYPDNKPYPSALFLKVVNGQPLHVVVALNEVLPKIYIITAYVPSLDKFEEDYKTRRKEL